MHRFRWVELQIDVILNKVFPLRHPRDVELAIDKIRHSTGHSSLDAVYDDILALNTQGQEYTHQLAIKALNWVLSSFKPLTLSAFVEAVALDERGLKDPVVDQAFVLQICSNFIRVNSSGDIRFAHRSVKEYLARGIGSPKVRRHFQAATTCLKFLLSLESESRYGSLLHHPRDNTESICLSDFEMYACLLWASHCKKARDSDLFRRDLKYLCLQFLLPSKPGARVSDSYSKWNNLLWRIFHTDYEMDGKLRQHLEDAISLPANPLLAACIWGFTEVAALCMSDFPSLTQNPNHRGKSPLFLACENGHHEIIKILIRRNPLGDAVHPVWGSYLQAAAWSGDFQSFKFLLSAGFSLNKQGGCYGRVLDAAIAGGNEKIVALALREGATVWLAPDPLEIPFLGRKAAPLLPVMKIPSKNHISQPEQWVRESRRHFDPRFWRDTHIQDRASFDTRLSLASIKRSQLLFYLELWADERASSKWHGHSFACVSPKSRDRGVRPIDLENLVQRTPSSLLEKIPLRQYTLFRKASFHKISCFKFDESDLTFERFKHSWRYEPSMMSLLNVSFTLSRSHVTKELWPYICPFGLDPSCEMLFNTRLGWELHITDLHGTFSSGTTPCPFCQVDLDWSSSDESFLPHVAHHLEEQAWDSLSKAEWISGAPAKEDGLWSLLDELSSTPKSMASITKDSDSSGKDGQSISGWSSEGSSANSTQSGSDLQSGGDSQSGSDCDLKATQPARRSPLSRRPSLAQTTIQASP